MAMEGSGTSPFMSLKHPASVFTMVAKTSNDMLFTGCCDDQIRVWDLACYSCSKVLKGHAR
jgi:hypothetical protein